MACGGLEQVYLTFCDPRRIGSSRSRNGKLASDATETQHRRANARARALRVGRGRRETSMRRRTRKRKRLTCTAAALEKARRSGIAGGRSAASGACHWPRLHPVSPPAMDGHGSAPSPAPALPHPSRSARTPVRSLVHQALPCFTLTPSGLRATSIRRPSARRDTLVERESGTAEQRTSPTRCYRMDIPWPSISPPLLGRFPFSLGSSEALVIGFERQTATSSPALSENEALVASANLASRAPSA